METRISALFLINLFGEHHLGLQTNCLLPKVSPVVGLVTLIGEKFND